MKDHIAVGKHTETGLYHGLLYVNKPTPSGSPRPILQAETKRGHKTKKDALNDILSQLPAEYLKTLDIPEIE